MGTFLESKVIRQCEEIQSCYQGLSLRGQGQGQVFFLKAKAKAKDMKIFQGQHQGQLRQLPLRAKICIAVTKTEYAYLIKHNDKETICGGFGIQY